VPDINDPFNPRHGVDLHDCDRRELRMTPLGNEQLTKQQMKDFSEAQELQVAIVSAFCGASHQATTAQLCRTAFRACGFLPWYPQQVMKSRLCRATRAPGAQIQHGSGELTSTVR
jgi:hypothetical protein